MKALFLLLFPAAALFSCSSNHSEANGTTGDTSATQVPKTSQDVELAGLYSKSHFINCADNAKLVVKGDTKKLDSLYKSILPASYDGQTIFVKLKGTLESGELTVKDVLQAEQKNDKNTCITFDYWCRGNEPFWIVQVSEKENLIDFYNPMEQKYYHFSFSKPETKQNVTMYTAEDKAGNHKIKITVAAETCSDGMSELTYPYKSEVVLDGTTYKGCAVSPSMPAK